MRSAANSMEQQTGLATDKAVRILSSIQAQWTVPPEPKVIPGKTSDVSMWIGIGGVTGSLVQEGISWESKNGGTPQLFGWYEFVNDKTGPDFCCNFGQNEFARSRSGG